MTSGHTLCIFGMNLSRVLEGPALQLGSITSPARERRRNVGRLESNAQRKSSEPCNRMMIGCEIGQTKIANVGPKNGKVFKKLAKSHPNPLVSDELHVNFD